MCYCLFHFFEESQGLPLRLTPSSVSRIISLLSPSAGIDKVARIVIFDDDIVEGKYVYELKSLIFSLGDFDVVSICLLDRTSRVVYHNNISKSNNHRFWKFDVPPLGRDSGCILCESIKIVNQFSNQQKYTSYRNRTKIWTKIWGARDIYTDWGEGGLNSEMLPNNFNNKVSIGIKYDGNEHSKEKFYIFRTSSFTSSLIELSRVPMRFDVCLSRAKKIKKMYPQLAIEILATQYLLFFDKLSFDEKFYRLSLMIDIGILFECDSNCSALIGLCFALCEGPISSYLWKKKISKLLKIIKIKTIDFAISLSLIYGFLNENEMFHLVHPPVNEIETHNFLMIGVEKSHYYNVNVFFNCVGLHGAERHLSPFYLCLYNLKDEATGVALHLIVQVMHYVQIILKCLEAFSVNGIMIHHIENDCITSDIADVKIQLATIRKFIDCKTADHMFFEDLHQYYYGMNNCLSKKYRDAFYVKLCNKEKIFSILHRVILTDSCKQKYTLQYPEQPFPTIIPINTTNWNADYYVYMDYFAITCFHDIILNTGYRTDGLCLERNGTFFHGDVLWEIDMDTPDFIAFHFYNKTSNCRIKLSPKSSICAVARVGGECNTFSDFSVLPGAIVAHSIIKLPLSTFKMEA
ncbi:hypothetical protein DVDV_2039 [Desulfovibrio sp. DV]|uniref:hypothetical protein n=1 Tax=Desulfovibrio sp. DV TaxID=1844708 RepID=UPI000966D6DC|nr:hypothetical protein [Desulfovibrio sp. DV]OLN27625.1 hypothetical protein DVDV_2039 [Desulfovibrio sp. DV]